MTSEGIVQILKDRLETDNSLEYSETEVQIDPLNKMETRGMIKKFVHGQWLMFRVHVEQLGLSDELGSELNRRF